MAAQPKNVSQPNLQKETQKKAFSAGGNGENEIRREIDAFADAFRAKDLEKLMSFYANDIVSFDMIPPLKYQGKENYRKSWEKGLSMMEGPITYEARDVEVSAEGDLGFGHCLCHMKCGSKEGPVDVWSRWTGCFKKVNGKWLVTHEHISVPVDMESGKALMNLSPDESVKH